MHSTAMLRDCPSATHCLRKGKVRDLWTCNKTWLSHRQSLWFSSKHLLTIRRFIRFTSHRNSTVCDCVSSSHNPLSCFPSRSERAMSQALSQSRLREGGSCIFSTSHRAVPQSAALAVRVAVARSPRLWQGKRRVQGALSCRRGSAGGGHLD